MIRRQLNMKLLVYRIWSCQLKLDYRIVELAEALLVPNRNYCKIQYVRSTCITRRDSIFEMESYKLLLWPLMIRKQSQLRFYLKLISLSLYSPRESV